MKKLFFSTDSYWHADCMSPTDMKTINPSRLPSDQTSRSLLNNTFIWDPLSIKNFPELIVDLEMDDLLPYPLKPLVAVGNDG